MKDNLGLERWNDRLAALGEMEPCVVKSTLSPSMRAVAVDSGVGRERPYSVFLA